MDRIVIAHAHIFKNAGTTIDWILQRNFGKKFLDDRNDQLIRSDTEYVAKLLSKNKKLKAFSSHSLPLPVNQIEGIDLQVMCMLRHPLLRVRSVYDFERKQMKINHYFQEVYAFFVNLLFKMVSVNQGGVST